MANLKEIRTRIHSIKETQKITSAMKMVAAARLRRAQEQLEQHEAYHAGVQHLTRRVFADDPQLSGTHPLLFGIPDSQSHLVIVITSDRGLCGGFNASLIREAIKVAKRYHERKHTVDFYCVGHRGKEQLAREFGEAVVQWNTDLSKGTLTSKVLNEVSDQILKCIEHGKYETVHVIYSRFKNTISQELTTKKLIPAPSKQGADLKSMYILEPNTASLLETLIPYALKVQIHHMLLENNASEHGARMTAMDSATRNAQDVIYDLEVTYNRTRQAMITRELIEIISGAEAL